MDETLELVAGFGSAVITPPFPAKLSGFAVRTAPSQGVHDDLTAKAMAVGAGDEALVHVVLDLMAVDSPCVARIRRRLADGWGVLPERVAVSATHTHGGPATLGQARLGTVDDEVLRRVEDGAVAAAGAALAAREPARLKLGLGREDTVGRNRRRRDGPIDPHVGVARFERPNGEVLGLHVNYACHPVTVGPDNLLFTRDYPGVVCDTLETLYPGATVMFSTGCCGQINTGHTAEDSIRGVGMQLRTFEEAARLGRLLAAAALHESERLADPRRQGPVVVPPLAVARSAIDLPLAKLDPPEAGLLASAASELRVLRAAGVPLAETLEREAWLGWAESFDPRLTHLPAEVQVLRVGRFCLALFPGEPFVEFALNLRAARPDLVVFPVGYANSMPGYLPYVDAFPDGGYEVATSYLYYGTPAPFLPESSNVLEAAMLSAVAATDASKG